MQVKHIIAREIISSYFKFDYLFIYSFNRLLELAKTYTV